MARKLTKAKASPDVPAARPPWTCRACQTTNDNDGACAGCGESRPN